MPELEDRTSIQLALQEILSLLASNNLDPKRAGLLLYGLQIASSNLPRQTPQQLESQPDPIEDILFDDLHGPIAPEAEYQTTPGRKTLEQILREQWAQDDLDEAARQRVPHDHEAEGEVIVGEIPPPPQTLPTLQAVAAPTPTRTVLTTKTAVNTGMTLFRVKSS